MCLTSPFVTNYFNIIILPMISQQHTFEKCYLALMLKINLHVYEFRSVNNSYLHLMPYYIRKSDQRH